jgi:hypothetical protein
VRLGIDRILAVARAPGQQRVAVEGEAALARADRIGQIGRRRQVERPLDRRMLDRALAWALVNMLVDTGGGGGGTALGAIIAVSARPAIRFKTFFMGFPSLFSQYCVRFAW